MNLAFLTKNPAACSPWAERTLLCLAVVLAYSSVWPNQFLFDDKFIIVYNNFLKHWSSLPQLLTHQNFVGSGRTGGFYRPLPLLLYFFIYQAFGASTIAFHALNIALQSLNACLLHHFGVRAGSKKGAAFAAALLWAVHPLHTEAVTYMSAASELLWSTFCLAGLIALLPDFAQRRSGAEQIPGAFAPRRVNLALIFFALALCSKESAIVFPALAVTTLFFVSKERAQAATYLKTWPLWMIAGGYAALWVIFMHTTGYSMDQTGDADYHQRYTANIINRILTSFATLPVYAGLIVWPEGLHMERRFPVFDTLLDWQAAAGALMVTLAFAQVWWGRAKRGLALSFGLLWFAVALSPATGIIFPVNALITERWMYLPLMGLLLGVTQTAAVIFEKKQNAARLLVCVIALALGTATFLQNRTWRNTETFYQNVEQNGGATMRLRDFLGLYYTEQHEFDKAAAQYRYQIDHPDKRAATLWAGPHQALALVLLQVAPDENGDYAVDDVISAAKTSPHAAEAIAELDKALDANPNFYLAHEYLAIIYRAKGNNALADKHEKRVKEILQRRR